MILRTYYDESNQIEVDTITNIPQAQLIVKRGSDDPVVNQCMPTQGHDTHVVVRARYAQNPGA